MRDNPTTNTCFADRCSGLSRLAVLRTETLRQEARIINGFGRSLLKANRAARSSSCCCGVRQLLENKPRLLLSRDLSKSIFAAGLGHFEKVPS